MAVGVGETSQSAPTFGGRRKTIWTSCALSKIYACSAGNANGNCGGMAAKRRKQLKSTNLDCRRPSPTRKLSRLAQGLWFLRLLRFFAACSTPASKVEQVQRAPFATRIGRPGHQIGIVSAFKRRFSSSGFAGPSLKPSNRHAGGDGESEPRGKIDWNRERAPPTLGDAGDIEPRA